MKSRTIIVIGGAQGGPTAAARAREFDEHAHIILLEKNPKLNWVHAGLRYHLEGRVPGLSKLDEERAASFAEKYKIDLRTGTEATAVDMDAKVLHVRVGKERSRLHFDALIFAGGAVTKFPAVAGLNKRDAGLCGFRNRPDLETMEAAIERGAQKAVVIGAGPNGLDAAQALKAQGLAVTILEQNSRILPALSWLGSKRGIAALREAGLEIRVGCDVASVSVSDHGKRRLHLNDGEILDADLVISAIGLSPRTDFMAKAGASLNPDGSLRADPHMRTTLPNVYACGTAVCVPHAVTGSHLWMPQAAIVDRTARIAGRSAAVGQKGDLETLKPIAGTVLFSIGDTWFACTGLSEIAARKYVNDPADISVYTVHSRTREAWLAPNPEEEDAICVRMFVDTAKERIVGAEAWGNHGVARRIDILAAAVAEEWSPSRLAAMDLAYDPATGPAYDSVHAIGHLGSMAKEGASWPISPESLMLKLRSKEALGIIDLSGDFAAEGHERLLIPLEGLRAKLAELDVNQEWVIISNTGRRSHAACRIMRQSGFQNAFHLDGGARSWDLLKD